MGEYERKSVKFPAKMSTCDNCVCSACHNVGEVIKLKIPETKYFDGKKLTTRYGELWLCMDCRKKLIRALKIDGASDAE